MHLFQPAFHIQSCCHFTNVQTLAAGRRNDLVSSSLQIRPTMAQLPGRRNDLVSSSLQKATMAQLLGRRNDLVSSSLQMPHHGAIAWETKRPRFVLIANAPPWRNCLGDETTPFRPPSLREAFAFSMRTKRGRFVSQAITPRQRGRNEVVSSPKQSRPDNEDETGSFRLPSNHTPTMRTKRGRFVSQAITHRQ